MNGGFLNTLHRTYASVLEGFVDRGDPQLVDLQTADFTFDGEEHDISLPSIVPANAKAVLMELTLSATTYSVTMYLRKKENIYFVNGAAITTQRVGTTMNADVILGIGPSNKLTYMSYGATILEFFIVVKGWWI